MSSPSPFGGSLYGILEFPKIRHCEGAKQREQSHLLSLERDCFVSLTPRNDGISAMTNSRNDGILDEILNEIASAFSKPRNDGILGILI